MENKTRSTGFELIREHLRQASSLTFFNAHTAHVAANILFEMSQQNGKTSTDTVGLTAISEALYEIERGPSRLSGLMAEVFFGMKKVFPC